jgi:hypothetical protein
VNQAAFKDVDGDENLLSEVVRQCHDQVMTPNLLEKCGHFDHAAFINGSIRHFHKLVGLSQVPTRRIIIQADIQSGKTAAGIGISQSLCGSLRVPMICLAKGVDESIDLTEKMKDLTQGMMISQAHVISGKC